MDHRQDPASSETTQRARASDRRRFLGQSLAATTALGMPGLAPAATGMPFDLLIRGGEVLDPDQSLRAVLDIGIRHGVIAAIEPQIPASAAKHVIDAGGRL